MPNNGLCVGDVALCCPACAGARKYCLHTVMGCFKINLTNHEIDFQ